MEQVLVVDFNKFRRWSILLVCSAARSFGFSFLEFREGFGMDGETPSTSLVLEEFRRACELAVCALFL